MGVHDGIWERVLHQARLAAQCAEVPVGAVVARGEDIIAEAHNLVEARQDPMAHAEILAIRAACEALGSKWLQGCDLYVSLEPCAMCAGAIALSRLECLYFGAYDPKGGGVEHGGRLFSQPTCHHRPQVYGGIREAECGALLHAFFSGKR